MTQLHATCTRALDAFARITLLLKPILPMTAERVEREVFGLASPLAWSDLGAPPLQRVLGFSHLMSRVERDRIDALVAANRESLG